MRRLLFRAVSVRIPRSPFLLRSDRFLSSSLGLELDRWTLDDSIARFLYRTEIRSTIVDARHCGKTCGRFTKLTDDKRINVIFRGISWNIFPVSWTPDDLIPLLNPEKGIDCKLVFEHLKDAKDNEWRFCFIIEKDLCPQYYLKTKVIEEDRGETMVHILDDYGYIGVLDNHGSPKNVLAKLTSEEVTQTLTDAGLIQDISFLAMDTVLEGYPKFILKMARVAVRTALIPFNEEKKREILRNYMCEYEKKKTKD